MFPPTDLEIWFYLQLTRTDIFLKVCPQRRQDLVGYRPAPSTITLDHQARITHGGTSMQPTRSFTFSCLALVVLIALSGYAFSATVAVGTCTTLVHFATIQLAVTSVAAGSTGS